MLIFEKVVGLFASRTMNLLVYGFWFTTNFRLLLLSKEKMEIILIIFLENQNRI